jgi:hypothetical protein
VPNQLAKVKTKNTKPAVSTHTELEDSSSLPNVMSLSINAGAKN